MNGKELRIKKFLDDKSNNIVMIPLDHGVTLGPVNGIKDMRHTIEELMNTDINGIVLHKGIVKANWDTLNRNVGLMIHLSASTELSPDVSFKTLVCTVEEAVKLGADGVSIHINLGSSYEAQMLNDLGLVSRKCEEWGMPLLAMMYIRGKEIRPNIYNTKFAARVAGELGADFVKVDFTGDIESFQEVVDGCSIPVIIAGGEKEEKEETLLNNVEMAMEAGARGVAYGRNVFQNKNPQTFANRICEIVHKKYCFKK